VNEVAGADSNAAEHLTDDLADHTLVIEHKG
jgi:hypothetical protein